MRAADGTWSGERWGCDNWWYVQFFNVYWLLTTAVSPPAYPPQICALAQFWTQLFVLTYAFTPSSFCKDLAGLWLELKQEKKEEAWNGLPPASQTPPVASTQNSCLSLSALLSLKVVSAWKAVTISVALGQLLLLSRDAFFPQILSCSYRLFPQKIQLVAKMFWVPT